LFNGLFFLRLELCEDLQPLPFDSVSDRFLPVPDPFDIRHGIREALDSILIHVLLLLRPLRDVRIVPKVSPFEMG
jgi:hypothetical protein